MRKLLMLLSLSLLVISGCGSQEDSVNQSESVKINTPTDAPDVKVDAIDSTEIAITEKTYGKYGEFVEEQELLDDGGVKIALEGMTSGTDGDKCYLRLRIENTTMDARATVSVVFINTNGLENQARAGKEMEVFPLETRHLNIDVTSPLDEPFEITELKGVLQISDNKYPFESTITSDKYDGQLSDIDVSSLYKLYESDNLDLYASKEYSEKDGVDWLNVVAKNKSDKKLIITIKGVDDNAAHQWHVNCTMLYVLPGMWIAENGVSKLYLPSKDYTGNISFTGDVKFYNDWYDTESSSTETIEITCNF